MDDQNKAEVVRLARKGRTVEQIAAEIMGLSSEEVKQELERLKAEMAMARPATTVSAELRKHLEWSWNCGVAEELAQNTLKGNAQWVSDGVGRGEDQTDEELIEDFVMLRTTEGDPNELLSKEWWPEDAEAKAELERLIQTRKGEDVE